MLLRWDCGCIGFYDADLNPWLVQDCARSAEGPEYDLRQISNKYLTTMHRGKIMPKRHETLDAARELEILRRLSQLIIEGQRMEIIRRLLVPSTPQPVPAGNPGQATGSPG